jgi:hypothetical protein
MNPRGPQTYKMDEMDSAVCKALLALGYSNHAVAALFNTNQGRISETGNGHASSHQNSSVLTVIAELTKWVAEGGDVNAPLTKRDDDGPDIPALRKAHVQAIPSKPATA